MAEEGGLVLISDEELYRRLATGDEGAMEALVYRYHADFLAFLYRQTGDRHLAEDLVQETFTRLVTYRGEPPRRFRSWAYTIAANLARDHFRSAYHRREQVNAFEAWGDADRSPLLVDEAPAADELLLRDDDRREVFEAMQHLSPPQREVLILRFYHELRVDEIAEVTGSPVGTVKSRVFHGLRQMKAYFGQRGGAGREQKANRRSGR